MSDMFLGSQAPLYQNVRICRRSKTGKILEERYAKNRVTRLMLYGIGKFLLGHFNDSSTEKIYEFIPRYLALGTNIPGADANSAEVTTISTVNDARLLNEITQSSTTGASESVKRIWIAERNMCKLNTKFSDPFIKISIKTYVSSKQYDGMSIGEAGLFSKERDNNCLARVCFSPIVKNPEEVLDIQWDITLLSYGETKYPEKLEISNGSKISLPLKYTNKHFKSFDLGLKRYYASNSIGNEQYNDLFECDVDGKIFTKYNKDDIKNSSGWNEYLQSIKLDNLIDTFIDLLLDSKLDNGNNLLNSFYLVSNNQKVVNMFHFGNLYSNQHVDSFDEDSLVVTLLYNENEIYNETDTGATYSSTGIDDNYTIITLGGNKNGFKIVNNQFYKRSLNDNGWESIPYYMYNGVIINDEQESIGYIYKNGIFYKSETIIDDKFANQYLNYSGTTDEFKYVYDIDSYNTIQQSGYRIDFNNDYEIYNNDEDTTYHVSNDGYWVTGEYMKLIPIISPSNATDKSVNWYIQNKNTAKINWDGVVTAWNIGETTAIASTSNDLRSKCIIDVIKDKNYIEIDSLTLEPNEITLYADGDANQFIIVTANVEPLFASNATVTWSLAYEISNCVSAIDIGNNQVKIVLNDSGNIGSGYLTATSQSGKTASCLINVIYKSSDAEDCDDITHYMQEG